MEWSQGLLDLAQPALSFTHCRRFLSQLLARYCEKLVCFGALCRDLIALEFQSPRRCACVRFSIIRRLTAFNMKERGKSAKEALWFTIRRMQCMAVQPLDLLPPADVTFEDYALAVLRAEQIANPTDPDGYRS